MSKKNRNKRKDPMKGLIVVTVLLVVLTVAAAVGGMNLKAYREGLLTQKQQAAASRNQEK